MNNILKLINELEVDKSICQQDYLNCKKDGNEDSASMYVGMNMAYGFAIQKLKLLLNDESKQPQPPDFANTMLGELPHEVNAQSEESTQAVEGATPVVRQNEQQLKLCKTCGAEFIDYGTGASYCGIKCFDKDVLQSG